MITNPNVKRILLYGDSFVFGKVGGENKRFDSTIRFSGVLQDTLGSNYDVIEEGLRARTLSGDNGFFKDRDGLQQFGPILGSQLPVELVVIMLGTNDFNSKSSKEPERVAEDLEGYKKQIEEWCEFLEVPKPKILLIAPPNIKDEYFDDGQRSIFGNEAATKVDQLPELYRKATENLDWEYFDASKVCEAGPGDGVHLDEANNRKLGETLAQSVKGMI